MDEAGISKLPAPIWHHILSFLDNEKEAVRPCVLSKSWCHLVSTRPNFSLKEWYFDREDKEKFIDVLERSLQVYYDRKLCIEEFNVSMSTVNPGLVLLLEKWIPIVAVKKFHLFCFSRANLGLPSAVFESESLQELFLETCTLSKINSIGNNNHLKTLILQRVRIEDESFAKFLSSCSLIEDLSLRSCKGLRTINMNDHHNLKSFELQNVHDRSIEIYLPSTIGYINIYGYPNWYQHRNYFPGLTCLKLSNVPLSKQWFNSFSCNFPCLEELRLRNCHGFDEFKLSSRSIKNLYIWMDWSATTKATIDAPSIKMFHCEANISQSISFTTTSGSIWKSQINLSLDLVDASLWFLKISEVVETFSQSQISLVLSLSRQWNQNVDYLSDISVCCPPHKIPVAIESLELVGFHGHYYNSFFADLGNGLFRIFRPREIKQFWRGNVFAQQDKAKQMSFWQRVRKSANCFASD